MDKFSSLQSLLESSAADTIAGLTLTSANYQEAIDTLKRRFGNDQLIVGKHMGALLALPTVTSHQDIKSLCRLYDSVESHVRGLRALGVNTESYGQLLSAILMNKLPAEMRLIMSRKLGTSRWDVEEMMKTINLEVEVRERSAIGPHHQRKPPSRSAPPTSSTLYSNTEQSGQCVYCGQSHTSTTCTIVSDVDGRTGILRKAGRCYVCLKKHHGSRNCRSRINCDHCRGIITPLCAHTWIRAPLMLILHWVNGD